MPDLYGRVIEHLGASHLDVVDCAEMREILAIYLDPRQAELVLCLGRPPALHGAAHLARKACLDVPEAEAMLEDLADRGVVARIRLLGRRLYGLLPIVPGFYELTFMKPESYPGQKQRLRELWQRYHERHLQPEITRHPTAILRVLPVRAELPREPRIYRHEDVERLIAGAGTIAVGRCACREVARRCDAPLEVCMAFDQLAELLADGGFARRVDAAECRRLLGLSEEAGLVHCAMNCTHAVQILCNCCGCCCLALQAVAERHQRGGLSASPLCARVDPRICTGCGDCTQRCWTHAIEPAGPIAVVHPDGCLGCGLCVAQCHVRAIELVPRAGGRAAPPHNPLSLAARMAHERGKTAAILAALADEVR